MHTKDCLSTRTASSWCCSCLLITLAMRLHKQHLPPASCVGCLVQVFWGAGFRCGSIWLLCVLGGGDSGHGSIWLSLGMGGDAICAGNLHTVLVV